MAVKSDFTDAEWRILRDAPHMVVIAVAAVGASGLVGSFKEAVAPAGAMIDAIKGSNDLLRDLCNKDEMKAAVDEIKSEAKAENFENIKVYFAEASKKHVKEAIAILNAKGNADDVKAYSDFLVNLADRVANAASEGGFLGFGGERVSEPERALIAELGEALGLSTGTLKA